METVAISGKNNKNKTFFAKALIVGVFVYLLEYFIQILVNHVFPVLKTQQNTKNAVYNFFFHFFFFIIFNMGIPIDFSILFEKFISPNLTTRSSTQLVDKCMKCPRRPQKILVMIHLQVALRQPIQKAKKRQVTKKFLTRKKVIGIFHMRSSYEITLVNHFSPVPKTQQNTKKQFIYLFFHFFFFFF